MATGNRVTNEKAKLKLENGGEISLVYGVPSTVLPDSDCFILAHGAGGPMYSPFITHFHTALAEKGFLSVKFNFPYMEARMKVPDKREALEACYRRVVDEVRASRHKPRHVFIGGKSMGGRIASQIAAKGVDVRGLFFLGYPLHPIGRPEQLRDEHLYKIGRPMLFVSGTRDAFATKGLLEEVVSKLGSGARIHWINGGDHSFSKPEGKKMVDTTYEEVLQVLVDWARSCR